MGSGELVRFFQAFREVLWGWTLAGNLEEEGRSPLPHLKTRRDLGPWSQEHQNNLQGAPLVLSATAIALGGACAHSCLVQT